MLLDCAKSRGTCGELLRSVGVIITVERGVPTRAQFMGTTPALRCEIEGLAVAADEGLEVVGSCRTLADEERGRE